jgi:hypothetical protein
LEQKRVRHRHEHAPLVNVNQALVEILTPGERMTDSFALVMGSWKSMIVQSLILAAWIVANVMAWVHHWDSIELAVGILVMNDGQRILSRRDCFKVATRRRVSDFYHHDILCRVQKLARETRWRVEERAIYGSVTVLNVQNLDVDSGAGW